MPPHTFWGPQPAGPLAKVTVPLTAAHSYDDFVRGLRLIRRKRAAGGGAVSGSDEDG